jgi:hypothetical protein
LRGNFAKHQEHKRDSSETKQNTDQETQYKEAAFAKVAVDKFGRGFVFHWMNFR